MTIEDGGRSPGGLGRGGTGALAVVLTLAGTWLWVGAVAGPWRLIQGLAGTRDHIAQAERALTTGAIKKARFETGAARASAERAQTAWAAPGPLVDLAAGAPVVRDALGEVDHLVRAATYSSEVAGGTLRLSQDALRGSNKIIAEAPGGDGKQVRIDRIRAALDTITTVRAALGEVVNELSAVKTGRLPARLRGGVFRGIERARAGDKLLADAQAGFELLPGILGGDGPRTYLLAIQNSAELRGTGGSLLQFKLLRFRDGKPKLLEEKSGSIYKLDVDRQQLDIPLPDAAWYVRGVDDAKRVGNANWSPHFPLSSRLTVDYGRASRAPLPPIDGVIGVDPVVLEQLLPTVGRPDADLGVAIRARNIVHYVLYEAYASYPLPYVRRNKLEKITNAFYDKLLAPERPTDLVPAIGRALATKHMQIWLERDREQAFIRKRNWDGGLAGARGSDYFYVVEQNIGGNKLDYFSHQIDRMDVRLIGDDARVSSEVQITNGAVLPLPRYVLGNSGPLHRPMINVYVPRRARLLDAAVRGRQLESSPTPELSAWTGGLPPEHIEVSKKVWSATLEIPAQKTGSVRFDYRVPNVVRTEGDRRTYRLTVQRQPKVHDETLLVRLRLPEGARGVDADGWERRGDLLVLERPLTRDTVLEVSWRE